MLIMCDNVLIMCWSKIEADVDRVGSSLEAGVDSVLTGDTRGWCWSKMQAGVNGVGTSLEAVVGSVGDSLEAVSTV